MLTDNVEVKVDFSTKFYHSLVVKGWVYNHEDPNDRVVDLKIYIKGLVNSIIQKSIQHYGVSQDLGENRGFFIQVLKSDDSIDVDAFIEIELKSGLNIKMNLLELANERRIDGATPPLAKNFRNRVNAVNQAKILDIGGRDRSKFDRKKTFPNVDYTILDILEGDNVDVVGDAHELSSLFPKDNFDFIISVSVFEHLLMPWKVAIEMNKVMKMGGIALIHTHQTIGMHDMPWDFWRFSDTAWDALFNEHTGFKIIDRGLGSEQFVLPFYLALNKEHAERSAGYEDSTVIVEKISSSNLAWEVSTNQIVDTTYPSGEDGNILVEELI